MLAISQRTAEHWAMMNWSIGDVVAATGGARGASLAPQLALSGVTTDSRRVPVGSLFVALRGAQHDGHDHVVNAFAAGAVCALAERAVAGVDPSRLILVPDSLRALGDLAAWVRRQGRMKVIAITGSNGKTTTKEMTAAICSAAHFPPPDTGVLKTEGNLNNLIGLPLTLLRRVGNEAVAVLEMGMNQPGEIDRLTEIAQPDVGTITNVGQAHLEGLGSLAGVAAAKGELFARLPSTATIAVNLDDEWVRKLARGFHGRQITYGTGGEVRADHVVDLGLDGFGFELAIGSAKAHVRLRLIGKHNVQNALAAAALCHGLGLPLATIVRGLEDAGAVSMRMQIQTLANGVTLINDAYNANPSSVEAALATLQRLPGRSVAVLGDMWELGDESRRAHHEIGVCAGALGLQRLVLVGDLAAEIGAGARAAGMAAERVLHCESQRAAAEAVSRDWQAGDVVLIKGSRGMKMEEVARLLEEAAMTA